MKTKIIVLHEIYGVNEFIKSTSNYLSDTQVDVDIISLYEDGRVFTYEEEETAYTHFIKYVGFEKPLSTLEQQVLESKSNYEKVFLIGFSVGATLAWRLSELHIDGVVCIYGSRIRHYTETQPNSPTLVVMPSEETSFDVNELILNLECKKNVQTIRLEGRHGFMDSSNANYNEKSAYHSKDEIYHFIKDLI